VIAADVHNAYDQSTSLEKYYVIAGNYVGEDKSKMALIVRALYGLKSSGASWRAHIAHTLSDMGFVPSCGDPDVWMRQAFNQMTKASYWGYLLLYVDYFWTLVWNHVPHLTF
jgi:fructose 1,6-bisphosphatase